ncbi:MULTISPECIES: Mov34/MPN/PAD-1 family protein [Spirulina sp. CCY15215]|uniref:Mov34/MPN/PAD-1 family protein n=1 Tax=Spirulina sp. CCY15215 TaxID=2767591 RepID=UPI00194DDEBA|nr:Mov34/MPN/PAD-1 family protein [Spirulina major]
MNTPICLKSDGGKLEISLPALSQMLKFRQNRCWKSEAGGVLMGRYIRESLDVVIDDVTIPMRGDRRKRFNFFRDRDRHQRAINQAWQESDGTTHYLGEWHTHPEKVPIPSPSDRANWNRHLQQDIFSGDTLFFIIVGTESIGIWEGHLKNPIHILIGEFNYSHFNTR